MREKVLTTPIAVIANCGRSVSKKDASSPVRFFDRSCPNPRQSGEAPLRFNPELPQMRMRSLRTRTEGRGWRGEGNDAQILFLFPGPGRACRGPRGFDPCFRL